MPYHKATKFMKYFTFIMYRDITCIYAGISLLIKGRYSNIVKRILKQSYMSKVV